MCYFKKIFFNDPSNWFPQLSKNSEHILFTLEQELNIGLFIYSRKKTYLPFIFMAPLVLISVLPLCCL